MVLAATKPNYAHRMGANKMAAHGNACETGAGPSVAAGSARSIRRSCVTRRERGRMAQAGGLAAEDIVARHYLRRGLTVVARRWRGGGGEIDLVLRDGAGLVFVEIKQAPSIEAAAERLRPAQIARIHDAIGSFLSSEPGGLMTELRLDVALVNGTGEVHILDNLMAA